MKRVEQEPFEMFLYAIRTEETRRQYTAKLKAFLDYSGLKGTLSEQARQFLAKARKDSNWALASLMQFVTYQKERMERKEITESTLRNYYKPLKLFCEMNDVALSWKKITKGLPKARRFANDRAPTLDEIRKLAEYPDRRLKPAILIMMSSGIRVGAWDYLRWGDIQPMFDQNNNLIAAKLIVYRGEPDEYYTFVTPEAYEAVKEYMEFRSAHRETINEGSWVLRDEFDVAKASKGIATIPKQLKSSGLKRLIERALWAQGIRKPLEKGKRRHEFQADHGFRKYFKTITERHMKSLHVEILMGHSTGLADNYYRVSEKELLAEYVKAVPDLAITQLPEVADEERMESVEKEIEIMKSGIGELSSKLSKLERESIVEYAKACGLPVPEFVKRVLMNHVLFTSGGVENEAPQYEFGPDLPDSVEDEFAKFANKFRKQFGLGSLDG